MQWLVTGGAGFIGSHVVDRLVERGDQVRVLDDLSSGRREFLSHHLDAGRVDLRIVDLTDYEATMPHFEGIDRVIHLAANPDIRLGTRVTDTDLRHGTIATYNVLESMRQHGVNDIAFASSSVVYGEGAPLPTPETHGPCVPISLYGASKSAGEGLIGAYVGTFGFRAWMFRFANIIGGRGTHGVIYDFIHKLIATPDRLEVLGDGRQEKSYMLVEDCADAMLHVMDHADEPVTLMNLGTEDTCSVRRIGEIVIEVMGLNARMEYTGGDRGWAGDIPKARLAIDRMLATGFSLTCHSEEAVRTTATLLFEEIAGSRVGTQD
ncbi:MAG: NAD-dependent epimerase/dehydratase family protein [Candidatus Poseidoniaceae archaeon]|jgi:UDP-glucose 4-epimerase|nr:NAD-dependent epimerase/dehydratase family protein [Candidatus Poseidoniaceae archaeon]